CLRGDGDRSVLLELVFAVSSVVGSVFSFRAAMLFTSATDIVMSVRRCYGHLSEAEYLQLQKEVLNLVSHILYLAMMMSGGIELKIASLALNALKCFVEAVEEGQQDGHQVDALLKSILGMVRLYQLRNERRRYYLNNLPKYQHFMKMMQASQKVEFVKEHPLHNLPQAITDREVKFVNDRGETINMGAHFSEMGGSLVKGMNLTFVKKERATSLYFTLTHSARIRLEERQAEIEALFENKTEFLEFLSLNNFSTDIEMKKDGIFDTISFVGKEISICKDPNALSSYDRVIVKIPSGAKEIDFHQMLSLYELEGALQLSTDEEVQKMKLMHLFHTFCPKKAYFFERTAGCFSRSYAELKDELLPKHPLMTTFLDNVELLEVFPGRKHCFVAGLVDHIKQQCFDRQFIARAFGVTDMGLEVVPEISQMSKARQMQSLVNLQGTTTVRSAQSVEEMGYIISSLMQTGFVSQQQRLIAAVGEENGGRAAVVEPTGSSDSVFVQATHANMPSSDSYYNDKTIQRGNFQMHPFIIVFDEAIFGFSTYQYHYNNRGAKSEVPFGFYASVLNDEKEYPIRSRIMTLFEETYPERDNIVDFIKGQFFKPTSDHEIMLKGFIPTKFIRSIRVKNEEEKQRLLSYFEQTGHLKDGYFFGREVEEFVQVEEEENSPWRSSAAKANIKTQQLGCLGYAFIKEGIFDPLLWRFDQYLADLKRGNDAD
ncbi:DUF4433 domain-containing protein, partial [bacterium]|nr:DUF4433 domain-containing protein [bacterium]